MADICKCKWYAVTFECKDGYDNFTGRCYIHCLQYCSKKCWSEDGGQMQRSD